jgi:hypothetical protein
MGLLLRTLFFALLLAGFTPYASAQDGKANVVNDVAAETPKRVLTGKERLGPKWTDEQRIDNCHVPLDKRGRKPRPDECPTTPSS